MPRCRLPLEARIKSGQTDVIEGYPIETEFVH
jgi:hypothetical protein